MNVRSILKSQLILLAAFTFSCGDEEDKKLSFKDQDIQGEMFGTTWEYADGNASETEIDGQAMSGVSLYAVFDDDLCFGPENNTADNIVSFYAPNAVGLYKLKTDPDFPMLNVTMVYVDAPPNGSSGPTIAYAYDGAIEILTITETEVTGRVVARHGMNSINGNFTVPFCNEPDSEPGE